MRDEPMNEVGTKESKHSDLDRAINEIDDVGAHLNNLLSKITGVDNTPPSTASNAQMRSLHDVLTESPSIIREKTNAIHGLIDTIDSMLF